MKNQYIVVAEIVRNSIAGGIVLYGLYFLLSIG